METEDYKAHYNVSPAANRWSSPLSPVVTKQLASSEEMLLISNVKFFKTSGLPYATIKNFSS